MNYRCTVCDLFFDGRRFTRRDHMSKSFCSIACVEAFEVRTGLPSGRIYETRPGWSSFPAPQTPPTHLAF